MRRLIPYIEIIVTIDTTDTEEVAMKHIQIPETLFIALVKYHLLELEEDLPAIRKGLMDKMDSMMMRELYSNYKTALTQEEKEKARKEYLDKRGVPDSFRW